MDLNVALILFNRPETTRVVFEAIRQARPTRLFVIADGPRQGKEGEAEQCCAARRIVEDGVDWPCELHKNYAQTNLGCRFRPPTGLTWVFENVEHCIILEDDCVPHPSFFPYCQQLLEKYKDDSRIMTISGDNFQFGRPRRTPYSYYFSHFVQIWGWATWRRAWRNYDFEMSLWPEIKQGHWLKDILGSDRCVEFWSRHFDSTFDGLNTWDYQWVLSSWINHALCILPSVNLISNISSTENATHPGTSGPAQPDHSNLPVEEMEFPLRHPPFVIRDADADAFTFETTYRPPRRKQFLHMIANLPVMPSRWRELIYKGKNLR